MPLRLVPVHLAHAASTGNTSNFLFLHSDTLASGELWHAYLPRSVHRQDSAAEKERERGVVEPEDDCGVCRATPALHRSQCGLARETNGPSERCASSRPRKTLIRVIADKDADRTTHVSGIRRTTMG